MIAYTFEGQSINATSDLSNDSGSSKRDTLVIRFPECVTKLSSKNKNLHELWIVSYEYTTN